MTRPIRRRPNIDELSAWLRIERDELGLATRYYAARHGMHRITMNLAVKGNPQGWKSYATIAYMAQQFGVDTDSLGIEAGHLTPTLYRHIFTRETRNPEAVRAAHDALRKAGYR